MFNRTMPNIPMRQYRDPQEVMYTAAEDDHFDQMGFERIDDMPMNQSISMD